VLAVAHAHHPGTDWPALQHDFEFRFIGLIGLADPLRTACRRRWPNAAPPASAW
jgi:hypothetical protein